MRNLLEDHLNDDYEKIDGYLDRLPDMNIRLWKQKINFKPIKSQTHSVQGRRRSLSTKAQQK